LCKKYLDKLLTVPDGKVSTTILKLYEQGIPVEPSGALSVSCLDMVKDEIKGKNVVCIISGATVDLSRFDEFKEFSLLYEGLKYFVLINLPLKCGIIREFVQT
jgi:threonine dehydratase